MLARGACGSAGEQSAMGIIGVDSGSTTVPVCATPVWSDKVMLPTLAPLARFR